MAQEALIMIIMISLIVAAVVTWKWVKSDRQYDDSISNFNSGFCGNQFGIDRFAFNFDIEEVGT